MQPTPSDVHVNVPLTNISIAYFQDNPLEFIADRVFPTVPVKKQADAYYVFPKDAWTRSDAQMRAPATESVGTGYSITKDAYFCDTWALHQDVPDEVRANADDQIDPDRSATVLVTRQLAIRRELRWAAKYFTTGVWTGSTTGTDVTPGTLWDATGSTPIEDMRTQLSAVKLKTGFRPNKIIMSELVWNIVQDHPDFLERIKYTQKAIVTTDLLAAVLGVDEVIISGAVYNNAIEGATANMTYMYGKSVLLVYAAPRPQLMTPSGGYTFVWTGLYGAEGGFGRITRIRIPERKCDRVESEMCFDMKLVASDMGAFMTGVIA